MISRENAKIGHRLMYAWMCTTGESKHYWPGWKRYGGEWTICQSDCFCCEITRGSCSNCPVQWTELGKYDSYLPCLSSESAWHRMLTSVDKDDYKLYCRIIQNLPWKGEEFEIETFIFSDLRVERYPQFRQEDWQ